MSKSLPRIWVSQTNPKRYFFSMLVKLVKELTFPLFYFSEKGDLRVKTEALKRVIQQILNGEKMPSLLMVIIKFLMPLDDHTIKKLLLIFWEIVPKTGQDGKLLQEMILVCDAYRKVQNETIFVYP